MSFSEKTLLVPELYDLPDNIAFFKVIQDDSLLMKSVYVSPKDHYSPISAQVAEIDIYDDKLIFLVIRKGKKHFDGVNTDEDYIMEKDEIDSVLQIKFENILKTTNHDMENRLIQEMIRDPSIFKKIPQELKDKPSFKEKVDVERTKRKVRVLDTIGDRTGTIHIPGKLPHEISRIINGYLDTEDIDEKQLNEETERKTRRNTRSQPPPQENAISEGYFSRFRRFLGRGTRRKRRTRRFK